MSSLDHTALEGPHTNNWIDAIIHKHNLINIKLLRDVDLNLDHLNWLLNYTIPQPEMLLTCTLDALKLELPNHWPDCNIVMPLSLKHIFETVAWQQFNHAPVMWSHTMIASLANVDIRTPTTLAEQLHNIPRLLHHNKLARN